MPSTSRRPTITTSAVAGVTLVLSVIIAVALLVQPEAIWPTKQHPQQPKPQLRPVINEEDFYIPIDENIVMDAARETQLRQLLQPRLDDNNNTDHRLLHLHHMKTGGTSTEELLRCAVRKMETIHECSVSHYERCVSGEDPYCVPRINQSSVVSYCAPLADLAIFGWDPDTVSWHSFMHSFIEMDAYYWMVVMIISKYYEVCTHPSILMINSKITTNSPFYDTPSIEYGVCFAFAPNTVTTVNLSPKFINK